MRGALGSGFLVGVLLTGCSSNLSEADSGGQVTLDVVFTSPARETMVFTLDDSPNASDLRKELASQYLQYQAYQRPMRDPARWESISVDVVILRPSEPAASRFHTSIDDTRLHWESPNRTPEGARRFQAGVAAAIQESVGDGVAPLALLQSWARATDLMMEREAPVTPGERRFVDVTTRHYPNTPSSIVTANEDASPLPAAAYKREYTFGPFSGAVLWAGGERAKRCEPIAASVSPRLKEWLSGAESVEAWPCENSRLFFPGFDDGGPRCERFSIALVDGVAQCRILVDVRGDCPTDRGWDNPVGANGKRAPSLVNGQSELRTCEMIQLEGAALESCRHELTCPDCKPGWCWTEIPELTWGCPEGTSRFSSFRMVLGSDAADRAYAGPVRITCNLAPK